jgi:integrase
VFVARRQAAGASNAEINRELIALKRMFTLAVQRGQADARPYIPLLKDNNVRKGFFEPEQFNSVKNHLPVHMQPIVEFAHVTGWRTPSEILPLEWRQVVMKAGEVRLDAGTTKNGAGRVFPFTTELRRVLDEQQKVADTLKRERTITRFVFCYTTANVHGELLNPCPFLKDVAILLRLCGARSGRPFSASAGDGRPPGWSRRRAFRGR